MIGDITARRTYDGKVSVVDVIADVTKKNFNYAAKMYRRLLEEERVPHCECRVLDPRVEFITETEITTKGVGRGNASGHQTPVATVHEMVEIIWQLPGTADFRKSVLIWLSATWVETKVWLLKFKPTDVHKKS